jgi:ABC-type antimicrobial peptide transport system permease subunit
MLPVPVNDSTGKIKMESLRNQISALPGVQEVSFCMQPPASESNNNTDIYFDNRAKPELWSVNTKPGDDKYIPAFNLRLVAGRNIYASDTIREFLVNETFVRKLGLSSSKEILNKDIKVGGVRAPVVGVIKDFYDYSFRTDIDAIAIFPMYHQYQNCAVKMNLANTKNVLAGVEKIWNNTYPEYLYSYQFLDAEIAKFYELDDTMLTLVETFAGIAIFIGCLGLYGLVSFMAVRKTKEIGVRKVLGANLGNILWLFGREFTRLLCFAFLIAAPIAWYAMHKYLQDFKYQIQIGAWIFIVTILFTFLVAAVTVSFRSFKAAYANPVKSLRTE